MVKQLLLKKPVLALITAAIVFSAFACFSGISAFADGNTPEQQQNNNTVVTGDLDGDGAVTDKDAVYLLFYTFYPKDYPVTENVDFNGDGAVTDADAVYLLFYTFFPKEYPLPGSSQGGFDPAPDPETPIIHI